MLDFIYRMTDTNLFAMVSISLISLSIVGIYLVKRFIPLSIRYQDDTVIGNTGALISVLYGVLAGLTALYLFNNNSYTSDAVQREANAAANIFRDSKWLQQPTQDALQKNIKKYINDVIHVEWPLMRAGNAVTNDAVAYIDDISNELRLYNKMSKSEDMAMHDILVQLDNLYDARQERVNMSYQSLSPEIWVVILLGTFLTLCINFLYGMNFYMHIASVVAAALMTASIIFLLVTLDKPFQGEFSIGPDAFVALRDNM